MNTCSDMHVHPGHDVKLPFPYALSRCPKIGDQLCYDCVTKPPTPLYNVGGSLYNGNMQQESNNARPPKK